MEESPILFFMEAYDIGGVKELQLRHAFVIDDVVIDSREIRVELAFCYRYFRLQQQF